MGRMYTFAGTKMNSTLSDLIELKAPDGIRVVVHEVRISVLDQIKREVPRVTINLHRSEASGSLGSTGTPVSLEGAGAPASDCLIETDNLTRANITESFHTIAWNMLIPIHYFPTPEARPVLTAAGDTFFIVKRGSGTVSDVAYSIVWEEFG